MKALTIIEMYQLRKWTRSSRRYWGQQRQDKNTAREDATAQALKPKLRSRIYSNLVSLLIIVAVVVVAAVVGNYVQ